MAGKRKNPGFFSQWVRPIGAALLVACGSISAILAFRDINVVDRSRTIDLVLTIPARIESMFFNIRTLHAERPAEKANDIVVIQIDDESLNKVGRWPWSRAVQAKIVENLNAYGAQAIAFDMIFPEPESKAADGAFADAIRKFQNTGGKPNGKQVIIGYGRTDDPEDALSPNDFPAEVYLSLLDGGVKSRHVRKFGGINKFNFLTQDILAAEPTLGFLDALPNVSGEFTHALLVADISGNYLPSLGLALFKAVYKRAPEDKMFFSEDSDRVDGFRLTYLHDKKEVNVPLNDFGGTRVRYYGGEDSFINVPAYEIIQDQNPVANEHFKAIFGGKAALVGSTATGANDLRNTPVSPTLPGMYLHANVFHMLNSNYFYRSEDDSQVPTVAILFLGVLLLLLFTSFRNSATGRQTGPTTDLIITLSVISSALAIDHFYFIPQGYFVRLFFCVATFAFLYVWSTFLNVFKEAQEKKKIRDAFGRYVAPDIVKEMLANPDKLKLGGEKRELTMFFSDVRDFTSISEKLSASQLAALLNNYMNRMTNILFKHKGTLDKYIGDAMVAFWNAPVELKEHPVFAVSAALEMLSVLPQINEEFKANGFPEINIGIGINTGEVSVGNMGSDLIFNFTALGDHMNLASRLEGLTKHYGANCMISEFTLEKLGPEAKKFPIRPLDMVRVKGKEKPVKIYEVLPDWKSIAKDPAAIALYTEAYRNYLDRNFAAAIDKLNKVLEAHLHDKASRILKESCEQNLASPPTTDWDGVTTFKTK